MSLEVIKNSLNFMCEYHDVKIKQTFSTTNDEPIASVICKKYPSTIEITNHQFQTIEDYEDIDQAASALENLLNSYGILESL